MKDILWLDLETRSRCNLPVYGLYNYAADRSTEILIASYALNDAPVERWTFKDRRNTIKLHNMLLDKRVEVRAHHAAFERHLIKNVWRIDVPPERWHCTSYQARMNALPASLEDLGRAITARLQKNPRGYELIRLLSIPQHDGTFNEDPVLMKEFAEYCDRDVEAMRVASLMLAPLDDEARRVWTANEIVNDRGLPIDTELCDLALKYADAERSDANDRVVALTQGDLTTARGETLKSWVYDRLPPDAQKLMEVYRKGEKKRTLDKDAREAIFAMAEERPEDFDPEVLEVIEANEAASAASVAKFQRMKNICSPDGRLRGAFIASGASGTGRFSSTGAQLHNFPRKVAKDPEAIKKLMRAGKTLPGPTLQVLKSMLRPAICAGRGKRIVRADWNAVEARTLPWLTNRESARRYMEAFKIEDKENDVYVQQARAAGLTDRQAGKVVVLSLGYGGAEGALTNMCKGYGVQIENKQLVVRRWRSANRWAPEWWYELQRVAATSIRRRTGAWVSAGRVEFRASTPGEMPALLMRLPSGRCLRYPYAAVDEDGIDYLKAAWKPKKDAKQWPRARAWGGLLAENATQATDGDLMRTALADAVLRDRLPIIGHVHDELVGEAATLDSTKLARSISRRMLTLPEWAKGLPLAVETDISARYRK